MKYHKITRQDCLSVATPEEKGRLGSITDHALLKELAGYWCAATGYKLGGYLGNDNWEATA